MAKLSTDNAQLTRRGMLRTTGGLGLAAAAGSLMIPGLARARDDNDQGEGGRAGDIAILRFLAAAELIETDFWEQYQNVVASNKRFAEALETLDEDMPTYVDQN